MITHIQSNKAYAFASSPDAALELPCETCFQTAWRGTRAVRCQAPPMLLFLQVSPGGTTLTAKRHVLQYATDFIAIA
ncbi:hypothetical protein DEO72_LG3g661 [Vigna unguiculata]|uniref:Uncharacterized protein n=1 Tax=Vigna unguiculata TaxID=3917 RepID=A0A4D6LCD2_VIGUN|nr:hypothetical protein DEO72_LG3g661 [Vigna unguiculata]